MVYLVSTTRKIVFKKKPGFESGHLNVFIFLENSRQYILELFLLYKRLTS